MNEASLRETVDEGCTKLHDETDKCTAEVNGLIQARLDELEHQSNKSSLDHEVNDWKHDRSLA